MKDFSNLDGEVTDYDVVTSINPVSKNYFDQDNFYPMNGEEQSNFIPLLAAAATQTRAGQRLVKGTALDKKERAKRRERRQARKDMQAKGQLIAAKGLAKSSQGDAALLSALTPASAPADEKKGLSLGAKIGIGVGIAAILGIGAYFLLRKKK